MGKLVSGVVLMVFTAISLAFVFPTDVEWKTDYEASKKVAVSESKYILLSFSGSDWCSNCIRLEKTLFESPEFAEFAGKNLVLLRADFPMKKKNKLSPELTAHNEKLAELFNKAGAFPTVVVLNQKGEILGELQHPKTSVDAYINQLKALTK